MILAVERDAAQLVQWRDLMEGRGHELLDATSVVQGLRWLRTLRPDVLLLDVAGLRGVEIFRWLRAQAPLYQEMPIIFLAALNQHWESSAKDAWPMSRVMHKPFAPRELVDALDELFGWSPHTHNFDPALQTSVGETQPLPGGADA